MTRMVLIQDELHRKYHLVTGNSRIEIELQKTVNKSNAGFSKIVDINLPVRQVEPLQLGAVDANLALEINCSDTNCKRNLDDRQSRALEAFLNHGAYRIKSRIETEVSYIKVRTAIPGISPFQINQVLVTVFPEIIRRTREMLELATQEQNLPFLTMRLDDTLNLSAQVDKLVALDQRDRMKIFKEIVTPELTTAYPPEEELQIRYDHFAKLMERWPSSLILDRPDFNFMMGVIDQQQHLLIQDMHLEQPQPGFFQRIFGSP